MNGGTAAPTWKAKSAEPMPWHVSKCLTPRHTETSASTGAVSNGCGFKCSKSSGLQSLNQSRLSTFAKASMCSRLWAVLEQWAPRAGTARSLLLTVTTELLSWDTGQQAFSLLLAVLYFQNIPVTSAVLFRHPRSALCFKKNTLSEF